MASDYDPAEFIDTDFQAHKTPHPTATATSAANPLHRAPTREEVDSRVAETQQRLAEYKRAQEELERERTALEEVRRRLAEFQTGRQEITQSLTRGLVLLEEAEFTARRDAEQMTKTLAEFREALAKVEAIHEATWTQDNLSVELTRALTAVENARMEWNSARLKFPILSGQTAKEAAPAPRAQEPSPLAQRSFGELCKLGLALTWPLVILASAAFVTLLFVLWRNRIL